APRLKAGANLIPFAKLCSHLHKRYNPLQWLYINNYQLYLVTVTNLKPPTTNLKPQTTKKNSNRPKPIATQKKKSTKPFIKIEGRF
ncbi:MAG: hypothetical protein ACQESW_13895, partial [Bacteroidota bacterium]